jgi:hypothetical protein
VPNARIENGRRTGSVEFLKEVETMEYFFESDHAQDNGRMTEIFKGEGDFENLETVLKGPAQQRSFAATLGGGISSFLSRKGQHPRWGSAQ